MAADNLKASEKQDPLIEAIAEALADQCPNPPAPRLMASHAAMHRKEAHAIVETVRAAGYAIVPREPTEAMIEAGDDICPIARGTETHRMAGGVVPQDYWRAMIEAAER